MSEFRPVDPLKAASLLLANFRDQPGNSLRRNEMRLSILRCEVACSKIKETIMKVLMVITSHDELGNTGRKTGFWLEELAAPYYVFKAAGAELTLAPQKGGRPPLDPKSNEPENRTELTLRFEQDEDAQADLDKTVRIDSVRQEDFDTVF